MKLLELTEFRAQDREGCRPLHSGQPKTTSGPMLIPPVMQEQTGCTTTVPLQLLVHITCVCVRACVRVCVCVCVCVCVGLWEPLGSKE